MDDFQRYYASSQTLATLQKHVFSPSKDLAQSKHKLAYFLSCPIVLLL